MTVRPESLPGRQQTLRMLQSLTPIRCQILRQAAEDTPTQTPAWQTYRTHNQLARSAIPTSGSRSAAEAISKSRELDDDRREFAPEDCDITRYRSCPEHGQVSVTRPSAIGHATAAACLSIACCSPGRLLASQQAMDPHTARICGNRTASRIYHTRRSA
jgi:hypothetical protein